MKSTKYIIVILLIASSYSCKKQKEFPSGINQLEINTIEKLNIQEFIEEVNFIQLQTADNFLIASIDKLIYSEEYIFVLDAKASRRLYRFDRDGLFLNSIGIVGKGPGEYLNPIGFCLDEDKKEIFIVDDKSKFIKYNYEGKFIKEKVFPSGFKAILEIELFDNKLFAATAMHPINKRRFQIISLDTDFNILRKYLSYEESLDFEHPFLNRLYISNKELFFIDVFENQLFKFTNEEFLSYTLLLQNNDKNENISINDIVDPQNNYMLFDRAISQKNMLYLPIKVKGIPNHAFALLKQSKLNIVQKIEADTIHFIPPISSYNDLLISTIECVYFIKRFPNSGLKVKNEDNPIIVEYKTNAIK